MHRLRRTVPLILLVLTFFWLGLSGTAADFTASADLAATPPTQPGAAAPSATLAKTPAYVAALAVELTRPVATAVALAVELARPAATAAALAVEPARPAARPAATAAAPTAEPEYATELHIRPIISPVNGELKAEHIFQLLPGTFSAYHVKTHGAVPPPELDYQKVSMVFSETPAVVPVWQLRNLVRNHGENTANPRKQNISEASATITAIVGNSAIYLPPDLDTPGERTFFVRALDELAQLADNDEMRIELGIQRFPKDLEGAAVISVDPLQVGPGTLNGQGGFSGREPGITDGTVRFLCRAEMNGTVVEKVVTGEVFLFLPQPTATAQIRKGEILEISGLSLKAVPVGEVPENYRVGTQGRYIARTDINPGEILSLRNLRLKPDVEIGDSVRVTLRHGPVMLRMSGTARGSGSSGDTVAVRLNSGVVRDCRIENNGEVSIE